MAPSIAMLSLLQWCRCWWPTMPNHCAKSSFPASNRRSHGNSSTTKHSKGHHWQLRQSIGLEVIPESDHKDDHPSHSGQPSPDGSLEARKCKDTVHLLSPPTSQLSPRASLLGSCNGSATSLVQISGAFHSRSRSQNTSSGSLVQAMPQAQMRAQTPARVPIPFSPWALPHLHDLHQIHQWT